MDVDQNMVMVTPESYQSLCEAQEQNDKLAKFLMSELDKATFDPKNPEIGNEGAGDAAIRLLKDYKQMKKNSAFLLMLETRGVDNWEGYDAAKAAFRQWEEKYDS